jgi:hypothetical protein
MGRMGFSVHKILIFQLIDNIVLIIEISARKSTLFKIVFTFGTPGKIFTVVLYVVRSQVL